MIRYSLIALYIIYAISATAQTVDQIKADRQNYLWGEGTGVTLERADQAALGMLINQISTQVESQFTLLKEELSSEGTQKY